MFGQNKTFGSSFGNTSNTGNSLFGQNKPSLFGQTTANTSGSNIFGQQKQTTSLFGGTTTQPQSTSLFGSPAQPASTSIFGNANKPLFGSTTTNTASTGLFGSTNTANTSGGLFGSTAATNTSGGGLFGSTANAVSGTTVKFDPPVAPDTMVRNGSSQSISTKHMCISAMKQYETKSLEELRIEDYIANRKAPQAGSTTTSLFGSATPATGTSLFGQPQQQQQQQQKSLFGSNNTTASPFGTSNTSATGTSLFGTKPATGGSLFGSATTGTGTFGAATTGGSLFGNTNNTTNAFGAQQQQQPSTSLFGNATNTGTSLFGTAQPQQQQQQSSFSFGATPAATTTAFGQPAAQQTGSLFGNTTAANTSGSLFGKPTQATGTFPFGGNNNATSTFGQPAANTSGGLFGNTAAKPGGLFGNTSTTTGGGLFGTAQPTTGGGLFGNTATAQPAVGSFGVQPTIIQQQQPVQVIQTIGVPADVAQMQSDLKLLESQLKNSPYGNSPLLKYIKSKPDESEKAEERSQEAERQRRYLASKKSVLPSSYSSKFITNLVPKPMSDLSASPKPAEDSPKDLNYTSKILPPTLGNGLGTASRNVTLNNSNVSLLNTSKNQSLKLSTKKDNIKFLDISVCGGGKSMLEDPDALPLLQQPNENSAPVDETVDSLRQANKNRRLEPIPLNMDRALNDTSNSVSATTVVAPVAPAPTIVAPKKAQAASAAGVTINKEDYFSIPTIAEMKELVVGGKVIITNGLTIGRCSYGNVFWPGKVELSNVALDEIVIFRHKEVTVYPNEDEKPPEGQGLNQPAEVTLERVWFVDKRTKEEIRDILQLTQIGWRDHLERATIRMGASFKDFRAETGSWVFRVEHFSKYGLLDDDNDVDMENIKPAQESPKSAQDLVQRAPIAAKPQRLLGQPMTVQVGLGGGLHQVEEEDGFNTMELQEDDDDYDDDDEEGAVPEKKPKLELLANLDYESSRFLTMAIRENREAPKCVAARNAFTGGAPASQTIGFRKSELIDSAIVRGRFAPVGWSSNGTFVWSQQPEANEIAFATVDMTMNAPTSTLRTMLETNVRLSWTSCQGASPLVGYEGDHGQMIGEYVAVAERDGDVFQSRLWRLTEALFPVSREEGWQFERAERLGEWLRGEAKQNATNIQMADVESQIWHEISVGDVDAAFKLATDNQKTNLASALAVFMISPEDTTSFFRNQIIAWEKTGQLHTLAVPLIKTYLIFAGVSNKTWKTGSGKETTVNCLEGLHWSQALGIHVWYLRQWASAVDAYEAYSKDVEAKLARAHGADLFGQLIKLAVRPQTSLEAVLDTCDSPLANDSSIRWHLWSVLSFVGYRTASEAALQRLHQQYAKQLEAAAATTEDGQIDEEELEEEGAEVQEDLLNLAFFVLQHMVDEKGRATAIQSMLDRTAAVTRGRPELLQSIAAVRGIPATWVAAARLAASRGDDEALRFELAIEAEDLAEAHRLFVEDVAPNAVLTQDLATLVTACEMILRLADGIQEWGCNGQVYAEYARLKSLDEPDLELLGQIEARLDAPVFTSVIQRLALRTMARELREFKKVYADDDTWSTRIGARQMRKSLREMSTNLFECAPISFC